MGEDFGDICIRVAAPSDVGAIATLRSLWSVGRGADPEFERRMADWLAGEGDRRTTWLATLGDSPVGMTSLWEYRRMPKPGRAGSCWGYISNMFVREGFRNHGIGSALLAALIAAADDRRYARLVLSPSEESASLYSEAGFIVPDDAAGLDRLLVRPGRVE
jgi:GNAT superfamily N-acetyltransferase